MYPNLDYNPHAPDVVGNRGLFFRVGVGEAEEDHKVYRVITRMAASKWSYMGQYQLKAVESITVKEWHAQKPKV